MAASKSHGPTEPRPRAKLLKLISQVHDDFQESFAIVHDPRRKPWEILRFSPEGNETGEMVKWQVIAKVQQRDDPLLLSVFESRGTAEAWLTEHARGREWKRLLAPFDPKQNSTPDDAKAAHDAFCKVARSLAPGVEPHSFEAWRRVHEADGPGAHTLEVFEQAACGAGGSWKYVEPGVEEPLTFSPGSCRWHGTAVLQDSTNSQTWASADLTPPDPNTDPCTDLPLDASSSTIAYTD
jgi:hypothetical protein